MLQPLQLEDVSLSYATQIAELRDFLSKAAMSLDTPETLADLAARLRQDSAFHRDLTSHVWVALDSSKPYASHADLLAMLAVAAAGTSYAAAADGQDAHALLRFLMEARRSFEGVPAATSAAPQPRPVLWAPNPPPTPLRSFGGSFAETESPIVAKDRGRWLGWIVAACLLVLLLGGLWWHQRGAVRPGLATLQPGPTGATRPQPATAAPAATPAKLNAAPAHAGMTANNRQYFARPARVVAEPGTLSSPIPAEPVAAAQPPARLASRHSRPAPSVPNSGLVPAVQPVSILPSTDSAPTASTPARGGTVHPTHSA